MDTSSLAAFQIQPTRGYLPQTDPLESLSTQYLHWDELITHLPELLRTSSVGNAIDKMPLLDDSHLSSGELGRAKLLLGMLAQAYVWEPVFHDADASPRNKLPAQLATPLIAISEKLDEPPIFNYADYVLRNWKLIDDSKSPTIETLTTLVTFSDRDDEKMFVVVHVAYEYVAGKAFGLGQEAIQAADSRDADTLISRLNEISSILDSMTHTFLSVKNVVSPEIFRDYIRLFLKGWTNNTNVDYGDIPASETQYRGETGSQSSVIPFFDALLGTFRQDKWQSDNLTDEWKSVQHDAIAEYRDFRNYMPLGHREFLNFVERVSRIRDVVIHSADNTELRKAYNKCIQGVAGMRQGHKGTVNPYIGKPGELGNLGYGTGGSDYQQYLGALLAITRSSEFELQEATA